MRSLAVGEAATSIRVEARPLWNGSGLIVRPTERYRVTASDDLWFDRTIASTADGQPGVGIQKLLRPFIRCKSAQWFQLIAAVGQSSAQLVPIGRFGALAANREGELFFFANDVSLAYGNNSGHVMVEVVREA